MRLPRLRLRTLMIAVAVAAGAFAALAIAERRRERGKVATVRIINRRSAPLRDIRITCAEGTGEFPSVPPGRSVHWRVRVDTETTVRIELEGRGTATFGGVRGGSQPTLEFRD